MAYRKRYDRQQAISDEMMEEDTAYAGPSENQLKGAEQAVKRASDRLRAAAGSDAIAEAMDALYDAENRLSDLQSRTTWAALA